jgi:hypothetical protein
MYAYSYQDSQFGDSKERREGIKAKEKVGQKKKIS